MKKNKYKVANNKTNKKMIIILCVVVILLLITATILDNIRKKWVNYEKGNLIRCIRNRSRSS